MVSLRLNGSQQWLTLVLLLLLLAFLGHFVFEATGMNPDASAVWDLHNSMVLFFTPMASWFISHRFPVRPRSHSLSLWSACPSTPPPIFRCSPFC